LRKPKQPPLNLIADQRLLAADAGAKQGSAMWDLALSVGRQALETLAEQARANKPAGKRPPRD
jgi:hypothetical protein